MVAVRSVHNCCMHLHMLRLFVQTSYLEPIQLFIETVLNRCFMDAVFLYPIQRRYIKKRSNARGKASTYETITGSVAVGGTVCSSQTLAVETFSDSNANR